MVQLTMCVGTAVLGALLLLGAGASELGLFGWVFLALGGLGVFLALVMPNTTTRR